ncbi:MAG: rod shape-determining protein RodA [Lentisphaeria bacterium]|nr:rod shape-determining protein RodA [Lentisphaeria bacterium]
MALKFHISTSTYSGEESKVKRYICSFDYWQMLSLFVLLGTGLAFIYSTGIQSGNDGFFYRQLFWVCVSVPLYFIFAHIDTRIWQVIAGPFFVISLLLLAVVLIFGTKISGAKRWLDLGFFNFQPSEVAKLALIVLLARIFSSPDFKVNNLFSLIFVLFLIILPFTLIFLEPDLGSALLLLPCSGVMLTAAGLSRKWIFSLLGAFVLLVGILAANEYFQIKPLLRSYHRARIMAFLNPEDAPRDMTYQQRQSELAVGSGGLWGKGIGKGTQHALGYLPQSAANNDFIFSVIAEEWGFFRSLGLLLAFLLLCLRLLCAAYYAEDKFSSYMALGIATLFFTQIFINIGVNVGIAPVTGLVLPFVSYGGSFLVVGMASAGAVQSIWRKNHDKN